MSDARKKAEQAIRARTPPGWKSEFVRPPWLPQVGNVKACRSCEQSGMPCRWATVTLMRRMEDRRVILFTVAMVCEFCVKDETKMRALSDRVFASRMEVPS